MKAIFNSHAAVVGVSEGFDGVTQPNTINSSLGSLVLDDSVRLLRLLFRDYKDVQKIRVIFHNHRCCLPNYSLRYRTVFDAFFGLEEEMRRIEKEIVKAMEVALEENRVWREYLSKIRGIGVVYASFLIGELSWRKWRGVRSLYAFCGLYPGEDGKLVKRKKGVKLKFNPFIRAVLLGDMINSGLVSNLYRQNTYYHELYVKYKEEELKKLSLEEKGRRLHAHKRACIRMMKQFLKNFYEYLCSIEEV